MKQVLFLLGAAVAVAALGYQTFRYTRAAVVAHQWALLEALAQDKQQEAACWRNAREEEALRFAETPGFVGAIAARLSSPDEPPEPAWELFVAEAQIVLQRPHYESIFVVDPEGNVRFALGPAGGRTQLPAAMARLSDGNGVSFHDFFVTGRDGGLEARFAMLAPLHEGGRFVGALGFQLVPAEDFSPLVAAWPMLSSSAEVLVTRQEGDRILLLTPRRFGAGAAAVVEAKPELLAVQAERTTGRLEGIDYAGYPAIAVAAPIPGTPWFLVTKVHKREITALVLRFGAGVALFSFMLLAAAAFVVYSWRRRTDAEALARDTRAQADKRALARHFDYLAKYANDIILLADQDQRIREVNDRAVEAYGYAREELLGMSIADLRVPEDRAKLPALLERLASEGAVIYEIVQQRKDGSTFPVESSARIIRVGRHSYFQSIDRDITERKRAEQRILQLNRLYSMLVETNQAIVHLRDRKALLTEACRIAVQIAGFDSAWVALVTEDRRQLAPIAFFGYGEDDFYANFKPPLSDIETAAIISTRAAREGVSTYVNDLEAEPWRDEWHMVSATFRQGAAAAFPLRMGDRVAGTIGVFTHQTGPFDADIINVFEEMAADLGYALENIEREEKRVEAERVVRDSEFRYRSLFDNMGSGVMVLVRGTDGRFHVKDVNHAFERIERTARADVVGCDISAVFSWTPHCLLPVAEDVWTSGAPAQIPAHSHRGDVVGWRESYVYRLATEELVVVMDDVTERVAAVEALRQSEERLSLVLDGTEDGYWDVNLDTGHAYYSARFAELLGYRQDELQPFFAQWERLVHPEDLPTVREELEQHMRGVAPAFRSEHRMRRSTGDYIWMRARGRVVRRSPQGQPLRMAGTHSDISAQRRTEEQQRLWATVVDASHEAILITDPARHILASNPAFTGMTGYTQEEMLGRTPPMLNEDNFDKMFFAHMWSTVERTGHWQSEVSDRRKEGEVYPAWLAISEVRDERGRLQNYVIVVSDISERKAAEERIRYLAFHDSLTGLPNRVLFRDRVETALAHAHRLGEKAAVLFVDLDRFKNVNDSLGHPLGDRLLTETAQRLRDAIRQDDTVSRQGGDEFLLLLSTIREPPDAAHVAEKVMRSIAKPFVLNDNEVQITASVGIALFPDDGDTGDKLIRNADAAMYYAKERGRGNFQFFVQEMNKRVLARLSLESRLRRAAERQEFVLHYQPQVNARTGAVVGVEALLRWQRGKELVQPEGFITLAEETGLIVPIGEWVMEEACRQQKNWIREGLPQLPISINVSSLQLRQKDWRRRFRDVLERSCVMPRSLEIELTEGSIMHEAEASIIMLRDLKEMGIRLAIDDFGTGYSSLSYLRRFPIDRLKVDKSFVHDLETNEADRAVTQAIISLAKNLGIGVIAEGVERAAEIELLRERQCEEVQGFFFSPPLPPDEFAAWWRARGLNGPKTPRG